MIKERYGAHFAWSHLWWAFSYPLAGWLGSHLPTSAFWGSSLIGALILGVAHLVFHTKQQSGLKSGLWHEHEHTHDEQHQHQHGYWLGLAGMNSHRHLHFHHAQQSECS